MTLESCSRYIELCPPPFDYSSKHMEHLRYLLYHKIMSIFNILSLILFVALLSKGSFIQPKSAFLKFISLLSWVIHLDIPVKVEFKVNDFLCLMIDTSSLSPTTCRIPQGNETYTPIVLLPKILRYWSCCWSYEVLISSHRRQCFLKLYIVLLYCNFFLRFRPVVYLSQLHLI